MDYKVVFTPHINISSAYEELFGTLKEANAALDTIADYTLTLHRLGLMSDHTNMGMVMERTKIGGGLWYEVLTDDG